MSKFQKLFQREPYSGGSMADRLIPNGLSRASRNDVFKVCETEQSLRKQRSAYVSMCRGGARAPSRVVPQEYSSPVPAIGTGLLFYREEREMLKSRRWRSLNK